MTLAEQTLDALSRRVDGDRSEGRTFVVPHQLVVRESSTVGGDGAAPMQVGDTA